MFVFVVVAVILCGILTALWTTRALRRSASHGELLEGVRFGGYTASALGSVVLYGLLSGQIVLPLV